MCMASDVAQVTLQLPLALHSPWGGHRSPLDSMAGLSASSCIGGCKLFAPSDAYCCHLQATSEAESFDWHLTELFTPWHKPCAPMHSVSWCCPACGQ